MHSIPVSQQAFLNVSSAQNPALSYGAAGILGLGFTSLSTIDAVLNQTGASTGRTLLYNLFQDNPSEPNFIAFSLDSSSDGDGVTGSFSIGVYYRHAILFIQQAYIRRNRSTIRQCDQHQQNSYLAGFLSHEMERAFRLFHCWDTNHRRVIYRFWGAIRQGSCDA